jgi:chromosome segregation protein
MRFHGSGIAAIVGPNGCGKSNLSDGISWVLGEQSAKSLRGTRMEDVIFAGTRDRKPVSMAQVTMTLVDPNHEEAHAPKIHIEQTPNGHTTGVHLETSGNGASAKANGVSKHPHEITITRRLYRNGDSDYLINGRQARLRDIQEIFMGTGLGPESYAIIEQGRIGQLLSSKPHDRRAVIEEAAGISKFKTKRRLGEAKLENAKQNLSRVFDILEEVGRQANSLKRQAAKAKRYQELHAELVVQLRHALVGKYRLLERDAAKVALELNEAAASVTELAGQVGELDRQQRELFERTYSLENELTKTREALSQARVEAERTRGRLDGQAREIAAIDVRLAQGEVDSQQLEQRQAQLEQEMEAHAVRLEELEREAAQARALLDAKTRERDELQATLRERERSLEAGRQQVLRLLGEVSGLKNRLAQVESHLAALGRDKERLEREEQAATAELTKLEQRQEEVETRLAERQLALASLAEQRRRLEEDLTTRKSLAAQARRDLELFRQESSRLKARKDSLEEILSHRAYTTESVKRLFNAFEQGQTHNWKPAGVLADFVDVEPAYEKAAEEFLHEELEYVLVKDWSHADAGIDFMRSDVDGRATFLVHPEPGEQVPAVEMPAPAIGPATGIVARLSDVLRLTNGLTQAPAALLPRLARCYLAEDRTSAQRLAVQYPDLYFLLSDGVCYHGHAVSGGKKTGAGPLALKRELRELISLVATKQRAVEETQLKLETLEDEMQRLGEELERVRAQQQGQEREAVALDHQLRGLQEEFARARSKQSVARMELERLAREAGQATAQREQSLLLVEEKERARLAQEEALNEARLALDELQSRVAHAAEEHSVLRVQMAEREERRRGERSAEQRLAQQLQETARRRAELAATLERLGVEKQRLLNDNIALDERAGQLAQQIEQLEAQVREMAARDEEQRQQLAALEEQLRALRGELQQAQERRGQIELKLVERRAELKFLEETAQKELKAPLEELAAGEEAELDEVALADAEEKCNSLKTKIENLGPVNPDALQEYEEAQQRYDFLNTQRQDLLDSIRDTEKAIQEIDAESKRRFNEAFHAINENFKETFTKLFGGGVAEMRLTDETNVNDSGIDIVASPPGKRLQNVLLLSGGEKALTALSLLMAIFRYTPSPFCVLDEVDAPLDEPNIQRLMNLLKEMSAQTQFIIITHAKRTMEAAASLYGVTMQEPGVSKLVSVRFNAPPPAPERAVMAGARA